MIASLFLCLLLRQKTLSRLMAVQRAEQLLQPHQQMESPFPRVLEGMVILPLKVYESQEHRPYFMILKSAVVV